jgi:hypothetical protein
VARHSRRRLFIVDVTQKARDVQGRPKHHHALEPLPT